MRDAITPALYEQLYELSGSQFESWLQSWQHDLDSNLRYCKDDVDLRITQGKAQVIGELLKEIRQAGSKIREIRESKPSVQFRKPLQGAF